jgi:hypothetical protein
MTTMRLETHDLPVREVAETLPQREVIAGVSAPKALFLVAAGLSFLLSVYLYFGGDHDRGIFVGIWVPSILSAGTLLLGRTDNV